MDLLLHIIAPGRREKHKKAEIFLLRDLCALWPEALWQVAARRLPAIIEPFTFNESKEIFNLAQIFACRYSL
jgi:hypothetical protein